MTETVPLSPESLEARIRELETGLAVLRSELSGLVEDVHSLTPLVVGVTELRGSADNLTRDLATVRTEVSAVREALDDRDKRATDERRAVKVALIALTGVIAAALISGVVTLLAAGMP